MPVTNTSLTLQLPMPTSLDEILSQGSSGMGFSAISNYLSCMERARLQALGIRRYRRAENEFEELNELGYGSLIHALLAIRVVHGMDAVLWLLSQSPIAPELHPADTQKATTLIRFYDAEFPLSEEPFEYLSVEAYVCSRLPGTDVERSVRYDKVIRMKSDGAIFSLEHKTSSRSGSGILQYQAQMIWQQMIWNANPTLVKDYGKMQGVIIDRLVKTAVPKCERDGPHYFSALQEARMAEYAALPDRIYSVIPVNPDGSHPRMAHACVGKFRPCEYMALCWEDDRSGYDWGG